MPKELGIIGQEVIGMLVEQADVEAIDERMHRYLSDRFANPCGFCSERDLGIGRVVELYLTTGALDSVCLSPARQSSVPKWADRFSVSLSMRIRFRTSPQNRPLMLSSATVEVRAEQDGIPYRHEEIISRKFSDIDSAVEYANALVP